MTPIQKTEFRTQIELSCYLSVSYKFDLEVNFMSTEFDPNTEFEFESDFDDDLAEFDDFDIVNEGVSVRTAILQKEKMVALLCIKSASVGAAICRVDPREKLPAVQIYDDASAALHWFTRSLRTSKVNGWNVIYDGLPLQG